MNRIYGTAKGKTTQTDTSPYETTGNPSSCEAELKALFQQIISTPRSGRCNRKLVFRHLVKTDRGHHSGPFRTDLRSRPGEGEFFQDLSHLGMDFAVTAPPSHFFRKI
jgi:hypothetical protein